MTNLLPKIRSSKLRCEQLHSSSHYTLAVSRTGGSLCISVASPRQSSQGLTSEERLAYRAEACLLHAAQACMQVGK